MAEDIEARVGRNLREIRTAAGLSIGTLACRTGQEPVALVLYEQGECRIPVEVLALLAATLDRPIGDFFR